MAAKLRRARLRRAARRSGAPIIASVLNMAVAGCMVGPDFMSPEPPSVTRYTSPGEAAAAQAHGAPTVPTQTVVLGKRVTAEWWTLFRSPKIDTLVKQAIAGSRTLESAKARLDQAREAIAAASSALYPQVGFDASVTQEKQTAASFGLGPNVAPLPSAFNFIQVGPTASYTPDLFGGTRRHIEQQSALAEYQRDELNAAYLSLTGNTVTQAIQGAAVRAQLEAVQDIIDIDQQNLELVRKERLAGSVPDSDVIVAESQLAADETLLPGLDQRLSVVKHALAVLVGRAPGNWSPPDFDLSALTLPGRPAIGACPSAPRYSSGGGATSRRQCTDWYRDGATLSVDHPLGGSFWLVTGRRDSLQSCRPRVECRSGNCAACFRWGDARGRASRGACRLQGFCRGLPASRFTGVRASRGHPSSACS
jgi:Outer membrane efflux protein